MMRAPGYAFDAELLGVSRLYRRSRELFAKGGGELIPTLVSAARTLGSPILVENRIEYSPLETELRWVLDELRGKARNEELARLKRFASSLFHEQNHRILWKRLPRAPRGR
ncbi:MAG: hypothetical protein HY075_05375 [Deltaproteobacteria bacterium]|nr:hypothetical protein [Deltaproteobacteria bacterium]